MKTLMPVIWFLVNPNFQFLVTSVKNQSGGNLKNTNKNIFAVALPIKTQASVKFIFFQIYSLE